jgi:hypothetical protein
MNLLEGVSTLPALTSMHRMGSAVEQTFCAASINLENGLFFSTDAYVNGVWLYWKEEM